MISLEMIEEKVPEFTYDELIHLPEKFVNSLKMHSSIQETVSGLDAVSHKESSRVPFKTYDYEVNTRSSFSREEIYAD